MIDKQQASAAINDIAYITRRVRQSRIYQVASLMLIWWGLLTMLANLSAFIWPMYAGKIWLAIDFAGLIGSFAVSAVIRKQTGVESFDGRMLALFALIFGFGLMWSFGIAQFTPRQLSVFWPTYAMLFYCIAGVWFGYAFVAIGLSVTVLTIIGYLFAGSWFDLWMAVVNGGGLVLGGLWMRRA